MSPLVKTHYLKDYHPPEFDIISVYLEFDLHPKKTMVKNIMHIQRLSGQAPLVLSGENVLLHSVLLDGREIIEECQYTDVALYIEVDQNEFELVVITQIAPEGNTALEGLYRSHDIYCTQCEAEGFRKITYFLDRPDVLTRFTTKIIADKLHNEVLLSNGNLIESGELDKGRHYAIWQDPFKKPCYLFALVAGNLKYIEDHYTTADNRLVVLRIYVESRNLDKCHHAMLSLKKAMAWDEERFGLIYDLDIYMIVAVDDFNMGAMENKGLNIFNSKFVLAKPDTATDEDYEGIESVIAHEYFHNWTGNRVTCRDWFQLTLKEGLTVFRDQEFSADMLSASVKRIEDVKRLRSYQFPEDAGPMSHPIQPQSYIEMNNFYTMTVYEKGAEVVRLYQTLLGKLGFRRGMDLYFERHDGQAVTVNDFRKAMEDANQKDLSQMHQWYVQSGTPIIEFSTKYCPHQKTYRVSYRQQLKHSAEQKNPLLIPVRFGGVSIKGEPISLRPDQATCAKVSGSEFDWVLKCSKASDSFVFVDVPESPIPSFLRGFSAPVDLKYAYSDKELSVLAQSDQDSFVRWESFQSLLLKEMKENVFRYEKGESLSLSVSLNEAFEGVLLMAQDDYALTALMITLPDLTYIGEQYSEVNIEAICEVRSWLEHTLAETHEKALKVLYQEVVSKTCKMYRYHSQDIAYRKLKHCCLRYLSCLPEGEKWVASEYEYAQNMTDVLAALEVALQASHINRFEYLQHFYDRWHQEPLVLDKWFALQAGVNHQEGLEQVKTLVSHPDFVYTNPNRVRSVLGVFGRINVLGFHQKNGEGYRFLMEQVLKLDAINPQVAARIVAPFTQWRRYDAERRKQMKEVLMQCLTHSGLSKDVYEIVSKSLD